MKLLVTGGAGFIGSTLIRQILDETPNEIVNVDSLTYAASLDSLGDATANPRYAFEHSDILDRAHLDHLFAQHRPQAVIHLAAESHVDRSIAEPQAFIHTNVLGTHALLEAATAYASTLSGHSRDAFRFIHVSTDEVFGDLGRDRCPAQEDAPYAPSSPYAATKAASDHLVRAWHRTYGLPVIVTNCTNNYGPRQFPEKLIPLILSRALNEQPLPIYGTGANVRDWLFVDDHARALRTVLERGRLGKSYNIGANNQRTNLKVVRALCDLLDELRPRRGGRYGLLIRFVEDRPGHDYRYALDCARIREELGWRPTEAFATGLEKTVRWYLDNPTWVRRSRPGSDSQRLSERPVGAPAVEEASLPW